jgi:hypothetical protein
VLNRTGQATKVRGTLNSLFWGKYFSLSTKKRIFCTVLESVLSCGCESFVSGLQVKEIAVKNNNGVLEKSCKIIQNIKIKKK